jgi:uncharacterized RDD family membrane protein YckC
MEESNINQTPETGLSDELNEEIQVTLATTVQRFLNFFIDNLLMRFGLTYLTAVGIGMLLGLFFPEYIVKISESPSIIDIILLAYLVWIVNTLLYYTICEKGFKGYTLGKLITGTRAIRDDGNELTFKDALLRSLCRLVPFEWLSGFGYPWHDTWTKTMVIKSR